MNVKLFELHEAYNKHAWGELPNTHGMRVCSCGCIAVTNDGVFLCGLTGDLLAYGGGRYFELVRDYIKLVELCVAGSIGCRHGINWGHILDTANWHMEEFKRRQARSIA